MYQSKGGLIGTIIVIAIVVLMLWGIGSCTRVFYDPFSNSSAAASSSSSSSSSS